jgi:hypothetical protein
MSGGQSFRKQVYSGWGVELDDFDRRFLVGIGFSRAMTKELADWNKPLTALTFNTRREAREALARLKANYPAGWKGKSIREGGSRLYRGGRVVALKITVEAA